jgi:hypothetical protein
MEITPSELKVLKQLYGPVLEIVDVKLLGEFAKQLSLKKPAGPGFFDLIVLVIICSPINRGVSYHVYEMVHSVFSPH